MSNSLVKLQGFIVANSTFRDRYSYITDHVAQKSRFKFEIVGIVGSSAIKENPSCFCNESLSPGQVGCALSHLAAFQKMVSEGIQTAVIIEDDAALPHNFDHIILTIAGQMREGEVISLHSPTMEKQIFSSTNSFRVDEFKLLTPFSTRAVRSTLCYMIDLQAARRILAVNKPVKYVADDFDSFWGHGCIKFIRIASPSPVHVEPFKSTIGYLKPGSAMWIASKILNALPLTRQILRNRRSKLRSDREANHIVVCDASPIASGNPKYEE